MLGKLQESYLPLRIRNLGQRWRSYSTALHFSPVQLFPMARTPANSPNPLRRGLCGGLSGCQQGGGLCSPALIRCDTLSAPFGIAELFRCAIHLFLLLPYQSLTLWFFVRNFSIVPVVCFWFLGLAHAGRGCLACVKSAVGLSKISVRSPSDHFCVLAVLFS